MVFMFSFWDFLGAKCLGVLRFKVFRVEGFQGLGFFGFGVLQV